MLDHIRDIESSPHIDQHDSDNKPILEPQLNVGGHGATQRRLRNYHVTMIGFCSGIGTGLFIGTGSAYANAGPAGLLLAYIIVGSVLWCVMQSVAELATVVGSPWPTISNLTHSHPDPYCRFISAFCEPFHRSSCWFLLGYKLWVLLHNIYCRRVLSIRNSCWLLD
jgi:amino acid permease